MRLIFLIVILTNLPSVLAGHVISQFYAELLPSGQIQVLFDVGYAKEEWRGDGEIPAPSREWLLEQSDAEMAELREGSEDYLRESLKLSSLKEEISFEVTFPDFATHPPEFPKLLTGWAYFNVLLTPSSGARFGDVALEVAEGDRPNFVVKVPEGNFLNLEPGSRVELIEAAQAPLGFSFVQGFRHVVPLGLDHILFIGALFLARRDWRLLVKQSLAFTVAHTLTLGLAASGVISLPGSLVEPIIALSIAFLAVDNLRQRGGEGKGRLVMIFSFGLIHGLGFASVLSVYLATGDGFFLQLAAMNLGVEAAQVMILVLAWLATMIWWRSTRYRKFTTMANLAIGVIALKWFVERVV